MKVDPFRAILNIYMAVNSLFLFKSMLLYATSLEEKIRLINIIISWMFWLPSAFKSEASSCKSEGIISPTIILTSMTIIEKDQMV